MLLKRIPQVSLASDAFAALGKLSRLVLVVAGVDQNGKSPETGIAREVDSLSDRSALRD